MRLLTLLELLRASHAELIALRADIERQLSEDLCDRQTALAKLRLISRVLSRHDCLMER